MSQAYFAAALSALAMAGVVLADAVMRRGTFSRWSQPLFLSCLLNPLFAWPVYLVFTWYQPPAEAMWLAFGSGVVLAVANSAYFIVMYDESADASQISAFDASAPVAIALITGLLWFMGVHMLEEIGLHQWLGVLIASLSLVLLHLWGAHFQRTSWKHRALLVFFALTNGGHMMLVDAAQKIASEALAQQGVEDAERMGLLATYPFFWLGMLTGILCLLIPKERREFLLQWPTMLKKWKVIVFVEILAVVAFGAQLWGFSGGHVALVAMICGTFSFLVFLGGIALRRLGYADAEIFPPVTDPWRKVAVIILLIIGIALASWTL